MEQKFLKLLGKEKTFNKNGEEILFIQPYVVVDGMEVELFVRKDDFRGKKAVKIALKN